LFLDFLDVEKISVLGDLTTGSRLILRCRNDWREAVISRFGAERVILTVASASGKNYRVCRKINLPLRFEGTIPILSENCDETEWRENLIKYDWRW
jgi:hypothetical protein